MQIRPFHAVPALLFGLGLVAAACGGTSGRVQSYGAPAVRATPAATSIRTATVTVGRRPQTILTDGRGRTLYLFTPEKDGRVVTSAAVLQNWPPLLLQDAAAMATSDPALPGKLGQLTRPDGSHRVTYNEWPLYTFVGDRRPGDVSGQGIANEWFVVQAAMPADADNDADGTTAPATPVPPTPQVAAPAFNDHDSDNNGGASDGDGRGRASGRRGKPPLGFEASVVRRVRSSGTWSPAGAITSAHLAPPRRNVRPASSVYEQPMEPRPDR